MEDIISKELLSEVLRIEVIQINNISEIYGIHYEVQTKDEIKLQNINIYELAHKCKLWALGNGYFIESGYDTNGAYCVNRGNSKIFHAWDYEEDDWTESEAIFKACQWISDNKDK